MARLILDADAGGRGRLSVLNQLNEVILDAGGDTKGGRLLISGDDGKEALQLGADKKTRSGVIAFKAPKGEDPLRLGVGPGALGGLIELRDADGQRQSLSAASMDSLLRRAKRFD